MNKELVISLYDKNIDWINNIDEDVKITIYRKGDLSSHLNEIFIENNVGRDVHTFFSHIVNNYNNLSDYTFFSQDFPFDHIGNYVEIINGDENTWNYYSTQHFGGYWGYHWNNFGTMWNLSISGQFGGRVLVCDEFGNPQHHGLNLRPFWDYIFETDMPYVLEFTPGAHFSISKEQVHLRSLDFYKKIVNLLEENPDTPWAIERFEPYIFHPSIKVKNDK